MACRQLQRVKKTSEKRAKNNPLTNVSGNFLPFPFLHAAALKEAVFCSAQIEKILIYPHRCAC